MPTSWSQPPQASWTVYVPCAVSSFFEIVDTDPHGRPLDDPLSIGARGGGFRIASGTLTRVHPAPHLRVSINGRRAPAPVTRTVHELAARDFSVPPASFDHLVSPPIGCGFGTSGSGALGAALSLGRAFRVRRTLSSLAQLAHVAELKCLTGLGTVAGLVGGSGAVGLVVEPGAPGRARVDTIVDDYEAYVLAAIVYGPTRKPAILSSPKYRRRVQRWGSWTLTHVLAEPTIESLLRHSRRFAEETGLANRLLLDSTNKLLGLGAVGATPNMIGRAVHAVFRRTQARDLARTLGRTFPQTRVLLTDLEAGGPRIYQSTCGAATARSGTAGPAPAHS